MATEDSLGSVSDDISWGGKTHRNDLVFIPLSHTHRFQHP